MRKFRRVNCYLVADVLGDVFKSHGYFWLLCGHNLMYAIFFWLVWSSMCANGPQDRTDWPDCCVLGSDQCSKKKKSNTTFRARCPKSIWRTNFSQRISQFDNYQLCCSGICNEWLVGVMVGVDTLFLLRCLFLHFSFVLEIAMQVKNFLAKEEWVVHIDSFQIWAKKLK